jgi:hypothetical protein
LINFLISVNSGWGYGPRDFEYKVVDTKKL